MSILQQKTLLYAEDELITQAYYAVYFKNYFKTVYTADNGQQALDVYYDKKPDVLILDINMPLINGLDVCKRVRKEDTQTKIILLTSRIDKEAFLEAVELGLTTYLEKPVTKEHLIFSLNKLFNEKHKMKTATLWHEKEQLYYWNFLKRELFCADQLIRLSKNEKALLEMFIKTRHEKLNYQQIYEVVLTSENKHKDYSEGAIKALISGLRSKLPKNSIKNSYGLGYSLNLGKTS